MQTPKEVQNLINNYFNLKINGRKVKSPYHINVKHVRAELRSLVGKGTPQEIEEEVNIFAKLRNFNLEKATAKEIREFMQKEGIGIDCSGLVAHILNTWLKTEGRGSLGQNITFPKMPFLKRLVFRIRPIENINVLLLTNEENSVPVDLKDAQAGDLIKLKGLKNGEHIAIITKVEENKIEYIHSTRHYGDDNGIKKGKIVITDENKGLESQKWEERDENGVCWTLKEYEKDKKGNGIKRPKFFVNKK